MNKIKLFIVLLGIVSCNSDNNQDEYFQGVVLNKTTCSGGSEPVFIIKLGDFDSIMTATLSKEFQIPDLKIRFNGVKESSDLIFCTTDKIYPDYFRVYNVSKIEN